MSVSVSILIPIKNEAANLPRCLASVRWADEVWVVDSASTDASAAIVAAEAGGRMAEVGLGRRPGRDGRGEESGRPFRQAQGPEPVEGLGEPALPAAPSSVIRHPASEDAQQRVHLIQFHFNGTWPKKKNWALENLPFRHEWVFILDADEELPPEAENEIRSIVERNSSSSVPRASLLVQNDTISKNQEPRTKNTNDEVVGYWINRRFMFMGKWLKHAYYPNWNLRLFKHRLGRYEKLTDIDTASGDNEVHEHVIVQGRTGRLQSEMNHYAFPSVEVFVEKHNRYSNWEARVAEAGMPAVGSAKAGGSEAGLGRRPGRDNRESGRRGAATLPPETIAASAAQLQMKSVGLRRRLKALSHHLPFRPLLRFCYVYFWQRGFLDGVEGYYFARLHGMYELLCVAKTAEIRRARRRSED